MRYIALILIVHISGKIDQYNCMCNTKHSEIGDSLNGVFGNYSLLRYDACNLVQRF